MDKKSQDGDWERKTRKARRVETLWEGGDVNWEGLGAWKQRWELPEESRVGELWSAVPREITNFS